MFGPREDCTEDLLSFKTVVCKQSGLHSHTHFGEQVCAAQHSPVNTVCSSRPQLPDCHLFNMEGRERAVGEAA